MRPSSDLSTHLEAGLVCISVATGILASYAALDLTRRSAGGTGWTRRLWIASGGVTMGLGIWLMHFIGMLAVRMSMPVSYDDSLVVLSLVVAVAGASVSLTVVTRPGVSRYGVLFAALFMGLAIAAMHYVGMAAMQMTIVIHWQTTLVLLSIAVGIIASWAALRLLVQISRTSGGFGFRQRAMAAVLLGLGVASLHYIGMAACSFTERSGTVVPPVGVSTNTLVIMLGLGAATVLAVLIYLSGYDQRKAELASDLMTVTDLARDLGHSGDTKARICAAVKTLTGADYVVLSHATDASADGVRSAPGVPTEVMAAVADSVAVEPGLHRLGDLGTVLYEPLVLEGQRVGVLAAGWHGRMRNLPARTASLVKMLAAEGAVAMDRDNVISQLRELSRRDPLTGLLNRRAFTDEIEREVAASRRNGRPLSLVMIDLDNFKTYNDAHGHQAGDLLLRGASAAWAASLGADDLIARYGGEEFMILLPNCGLRDAANTAERLRKATPGEATCSVGAASLEGDETAANLIEVADQALYQAKASGRDRTCLGQLEAISG